MPSPITVPRTDADLEKLNRASHITQTFPFSPYSSPAVLTFMVKNRIQVAIVSLIFVVLAIVFTYPLVLNCQDAIPVLGEGSYHNKSGDHLQLYYWFWLLKDNLFGNSSLFSNPYEFNTLDGPLDLGFHMFPFSLIYVLFTPFGDIQAYNFTLWSTFVLTAVFSYLLCREYGIAPTGAFIAATIFTLAPFRINQMLAGHLNGFLFFCIPFILYCHEITLKNRSWISGIGAGLIVFSLAMMEPHLIFYLFFFLGLYLPIRAIKHFTEKVFEMNNGAAKPGVMSDGNTRPWLALLVVWLAGISMVVYYQQIMYAFRASEFQQIGFWAAILVYPLIFISAVVLESSILSRFIQWPANTIFCRNSRNYLPLLLLPLYGVIAAYKIPHAGKIWGLTLIVFVFFLYYCQLKSYLPFIKKNFSNRALNKIKTILSLHLPLLTAMAFSAIYLLSSKLRLIDNSIATGGRSLADVQLFTPTLQDLWFRDNPQPETLIYLGYVPVIAICFIVFKQIRNIMGESHRSASMDTILVSFYTFLFFLTYTLALGLSFGDISLYEFCYHYIPFFNFPRVPGRLATLAFWAAALIAAWCAADVLGSLKKIGKPRQASILSMGIVLAIVLDFHPLRATGITKLGTNPIYRTGIESGEASKLLEIPLWPGDSHQSSLYEYFTTVDGIARINGYSPIVPRKFIKEVYNPLYSLNLGRLDVKQYDLLNELGVKYITIHTNPDVFPLKVTGSPAVFTARRLSGSPYLEKVETLQGVHLLRLRELQSQTSIEDSNLSLVRIYDGLTIKPVQGVLKIDDQTNNLVISARPVNAEPEALTEGPNIYLPQGAYNARIRIKPQSAEIPLSVVKVGIHLIMGRKNILAIERNITRSHLTRAGDQYVDIFLPFYLPEPGYANFSLWYPQKVGLSIEQVVATSADDPAILSTLESEILEGVVGNIVEDPQASGKQALYAKPGAAATDEMVTGPDVYYPSGSYLTTFRLKIQNPDKPQSGNDHSAVHICITTDQGRHVLAARPVPMADVSDSRYTQIPLIWSLDRPGNISFQVIPGPGFGVYLDTIETRTAGAARVIGEDAEIVPRYAAIPYRTFHATDLSRTTGKIVADSQNGRHVAEAKGGTDAQGYLTHGPYTQLPPGRYQARFHIQARHHHGNASLLNIEVADRNNQKERVLAQRTLWGGDFPNGDEYYVFELPFDSTCSSALEYRTEYIGRGDIRISKIELFLHEQHIEIENLRLKAGQVVSDELASGGKAVRWSPSNGADAADFSWVYPDALPAGKYRITWRIKPDSQSGTSQISNPPLVTLAAIADSGITLANQTLQSHRFTKGQYHRIISSLDLDRPSAITFRLRSQGISPIWLDSFTVNPLESNVGEEYADEKL